MNVKNNKRRRETIEKIQSVFMEALNDQELSKIKVSTICKNAGINRSTFYANFMDIYDLADKIQIGLKDEVDRLLEQDFKMQYIDEDFLKLFQHIKENQTLYRFYFKLGYDNRDEFMFSDAYMHDLAADNPLLDYHLTFFKSGFNAIVKKWLDGGCKETPEQMRNLLLHEYRIKT